jgi:hypothetical protein
MSARIEAIVREKGGAQPNPPGILEKLLRWLEGKWPNIAQSVRWAIALNPRLANIRASTERKIKAIEARRDVEIAEIRQEETKIRADSAIAREKIRQDAETERARIAAIARRDDARVTLKREMLAKLGELDALGIKVSLSLLQAADRPDQTEAQRSVSDESEPDSE